MPHALSLSPELVSCAASTRGAFRLRVRPGHFSEDLWDPWVQQEEPKLDRQVQQEGTSVTLLVGRTDQTSWP